LQDVVKLQLNSLGSSSDRAASGGSGELLRERYEQLDEGQPESPGNNPLPRASTARIRIPRPCWAPQRNWLII